MWSKSSLFLPGLMQLHSSKLNHYIKMAVFLHTVLGKSWKRQNAKGVAFLNYRIKTFSTGFPSCSIGKESTCNVGAMCSIPGSGRFLGGGHGNPLQYSYLENPVHKGAWQAIVQRVTKSQMWLKQTSMQAERYFSHESSTTFRVQKIFQKISLLKNSFESVLMRWMKLEPIIQSEVSQKDKDHYNILTHIYGI